MTEGPRKSSEPQRTNSLDPRWESLRLLARTYESVLSEGEDTIHMPIQQPIDFGKLIVLPPRPCVDQLMGQFVDSIVTIIHLLDTISLVPLRRHDFFNHAEAGSDTN
ncbi:hypothetical protein Syun_022409 [Stephania yunnanensis]|uniref:Uncharacterized protein n=1 Tax=Stephania yunnanensis TaxID=152371 RepID=A0AAP0FCT9_9MAGN